YYWANNLYSYTNRGGAVQTFSYDNRNRQTSFSWSDAATPRATTYDPVGNIIKITPDGNDLIYDFRNRITSDIQTPRIAGPVNYTYDADSNRKTIRYPSGATFTYNYNSRNQLITKTMQISQWVPTRMISTAIAPHPAYPMVR